MLYLPPEPLCLNVFTEFVSDDEVKRVVEDWKSRGAPDYQEEILSPLSQEESLYRSKATTMRNKMTSFTMKRFSLSLRVVVHQFHRCKENSGLDITERRD